MSRAWKDPDDVQQDMLDQQQRTNQLLEQILSELKNHFSDDDKKVHPGIIVPITHKEDVKPVCLKCHRDAEIVHNCFGTGGDWVSCRHCGVTWRMK